MAVISVFPGSYSPRWNLSSIAQANRSAFLFIVCRIGYCLNCKTIGNFFLGKQPKEPSLSIIKTKHTRPFMTHPWIEFVTSRPLQTGTSLASEIPAVAPVSVSGFLDIDGPDAASFLQGQTTCDIRQITLEQSSIGAFCNAQGRVIAIFRIWRKESGYRLQLPSELLPALQQRLQRYVMRSAVSIQENRDIGVFGLAPGASRIPLPLPGEANAVCCEDNLTVIRIPSAIERFLVLGPSSKIKEEWLGLVQKHDSKEYSESWWQRLDVQDGLPSITQATSEAFLPQMLNLDLAGGLSFDKGCYTGQEVIARAHYRGTVKRRLYRAIAATPSALMPGDLLMDDDEAIAQIVMTVPTNEGQSLLAVARCDRVHTDKIGLKQGQKFPIEWFELAYNS